MKNFINMKELGKGILVLFAYFLLSNLVFAIIPSYLYLKGYINYGLANFLIYLPLSLVFIIIYHKDLIDDYKIFKDNKKVILKTAFNYWLKGLFIMYVSSLLISALNLSTNTNQDANIAILKESPFIEFICAVILAPIVEELVFRRSLKKGLLNKHLYAIITGLLFGAIHIISSLSNGPLMLLYLIPYGALGISFGYAYAKTNNIYSTIIIHATHNALSLIILYISIIGGLA